MRIRLMGLVAAAILAFAVIGTAAIAMPSSHSHGKPNRAAADRHVERGQLRLHRRTRQRALHAALPRRLLHAARRRAARPAAASTSTPKGCRPTSLGVHIDADPLQRLRRLQPGRDDPAQGARASKPTPTSARPARCRSTTSAGTGAERAGRRDRRRRPASAGRSGSRSTRTPPTPRRRRSRSTRRSTSPPATATSSPCATSATPPATRIEAPAAFRYYRDNVPSKQPEINARRKHFKDIFKTLQQAGIDRNDLYLAWDFTVASDQNNAGRELAMRNDAFAQLGDTDLADRTCRRAARRAFQVDQRRRTNRTRARSPAGSKAPSTVPCYLFPNCGPGGTIQLDSNGTPIQNGTWTANFDCIIPARSTSGPAGAGRPSLYGHGLFGSAGEVASSPQREPRPGTRDRPLRDRRDRDVANPTSRSPIVALQDLSRFPAIPDRLQQGLLDELYLGRAMISPAASRTDPAFHQDGTLGSGSVLDTSHLYYNGNSQGGIMGGALTAVAPDFTRASLGVPAMNYSVLLPRSVDFDPFAGVLYPSYPERNARGRWSST